MTRKFLGLFGLFTLCILPASVTAGEPPASPLSLARVVELASSSAPQVRLAITRVAEGEAKLAGARVRTLENPKLDVAAGGRSGEDTSVDMEAGIEIPIELGKRRSSRVALATSEIEREMLAVEEARRLAVTEAADAYFRVLQANENLGSARERKALADEVLRAARERHATGDAPKFEVNLALSESARAESEVASAEGKAAAAKSTLARSLGLPSAAGLEVAGNIKDRSFFDSIAQGSDPAPRADLLTARAEVASALAWVSLAQAETRPDLAVRFSVKREGEENVALAGVSVTLPFFNPRTAQVQEARVRHDRALLADELTRSAIAAEIEGARAAYAAAVKAVRRMETDGIPLQQENEALAQESYRAGKINLSTLLQLRRDALEARKEYLERLLEAAEAGVGLAAATGAWMTER